MATSTLARPPPSTAATWWSKLGRAGQLATAGRQSVTAGIVYLLSSLLLFGLPVLADPAHMYVGSRVDPDPKFFFWALSWWPHALADGLNPLWTHAVWAPHGYNLAWATGTPGPSLLVSPLTLAAGPVVSSNLLALLACPLAAWSAFLLCRHVTGRFAPSLLGGYLFGFSTYMLAHVGIHVNLELVFPVPLAVYLVLRRLDGSISPRRFVTFLSALLVMEFLTSTEIAATMTLFGGVAFLVALALDSSPGRRSLMATGGLAALSCGIAALLVSPYLYYVFAHGLPHRGLSGSDLLSFVIPRSRTVLGGWLFHPMTNRFPGSPMENGAYLGLPLIAILVHFCVTQWKRQRLILICLAIAIVASLGPRLFVDGRPTIVLPWKVVASIPPFDNVAPRRLLLYVFLLMALVVALWLSSQGTRPVRWRLALLAPVFLFPSFSPFYLHGRVDLPSFFQAGTYRRYLLPGENILVMPDQPDGMYVQSTTGFSFRMLLGYTGPQFLEYRGSSILQALYDGHLPQADGPVFREFLAAHEVGAIVLQGRSTLAGPLAQVLDTTPQAIGGVVLFDLSP